MVARLEKMEREEAEMRARLNKLHTGIYTQILIEKCPSSKLRPPGGVIFLSI